MKTINHCGCIKKSNTKKDISWCPISDEFQAQDCMNNLNDTYHYCSEGNKGRSTSTRGRSK